MNRMNENDTQAMIWRAQQHHHEALHNAKIERRLVQDRPAYTKRRWPRLKVEWNFSQPEIEFKIRWIRLQGQS